MTAPSWEELEARANTLERQTLLANVKRVRHIVGSHNYRNESEDGMFETPEVNPSTEEGDVNVTVEAPEPEQQDEGNGAEQNTDDQA